MPPSFFPLSRRRTPMSMSPDNAGDEIREDLLHASPISAWDRHMYAFARHVCGHLGIADDGVNVIGVVRLLMKHHIDPPIETYPKAVTKLADDSDVAQPRAPFAGALIPATPP